MPKAKYMKPEFVNIKGAVGVEIHRDHDIRCTCGRKVAEKKKQKVEIKCVKCNQIVEV